MKKYNVSTLHTIIQQAWAEPDLNKARYMVKEHINSTQIKSKETILNTLDTIKSKSKLDFYLANSLLAFEGHRV
jgi:hypothetical protein